MPVPSSPSAVLGASPLATIEPRLRPLLPADLYAATWVEPSPANLTRIFEHLRTLQRILHDYVPRDVSENPPGPGHIRYGWQESTLMFSDLAGFTPLLEANVAGGRRGRIAPRPERLLR
jgi:adenylate cyclase